MEPLSTEQRKAALATAIRAQVLRGGAVQSQSDFDAVIYFPPKTPGCLTFIFLMVITLHLYIYYWLFLKYGSSKRILLSVDEFGHVATLKPRR